MARVFIGLGANLDRPEQQLNDALVELSHLANSQLIQTSSLYRSKPVGPQDQPDYVNAVAELETELSPMALLDALQAIEHAHGRVRKRHWGARTLDLDILLIDQDIIDEPRLQVPHPYAHERAFVLYPLSEIAPNCVLPNAGALSELLPRLSNDLIRINH